jgi:hypothetical protein
MASNVAISMHPIGAPAGQVTMSSLELVEFINSQRRPGEATLAHSDLLKKVQQVLGGDAGNFSGIYRDSINREQPCYRFPKREACLMAMSYSYDLQARVFDRMTALEAQAQMEHRPSSPKLTGELAILECCTRLLHPAPSSQIAMLTKIAEQNGLDAAFLPSYVVDAPSDALPGSSLATASLTKLLKVNGISTNPHAYNVLLRAAGMLEERERPSSFKGAKDGIKRFWCVTERGCQYGKNLTNPSSPRETQPHWYVERFAELHRIASARVMED